MLARDRSKHLEPVCFLTRASRRRCGELFLCDEFGLCSFDLGRVLHYIKLNSRVQIAQRCRWQSWWTQFHCDLQKAVWVQIAVQLLSRWRWWGIARIPMFYCTTCFAAAMWGTLFVRQVLLRFIVPGRAVHTVKLNRCRSHCYGFFMCVCSLGWRTCNSTVICKTVMADRTWIASSRWRWCRAKAYVLAQSNTGSLAVRSSTGQRIV